MKRLHHLAVLVGLVLAAMAGCGTNGNADADADTDTDTDSDTDTDPPEYSYCEPINQEPGLACVPDNACCSLPRVEGEFEQFYVGIDACDITYRNTGRRFQIKCADLGSENAECTCTRF